MRFKFKGSNKKVNVIFSDGDEITATNPRAIRTLKRHHFFEQMPEPKKRGRKPKKEVDPFSPEAIAEALDAEPAEGEGVQTEMDI